MKEKNKIDAKKIAKKDRYYAFIKLQEDFTKNYLKQLLENPCKWDCKNELKLANRFSKNFQDFLVAYQEIRFQNVSVNAYFLKHKKFSKSHYYDIMKNLCNLINQQYFEWKTLLANYQ